TFAAFFSRAYDFIRMAAISRANLRLAGSHAGISIGEDGPSQMALEDIASLRAVHSSTVLHPCDANQTAKLVAAMADTDGIVFLRTLRPNTSVIYDADEEFRVGGSRVIRSSEDDDVTIVGAGVTVHEALKAAESLEEDGIMARVIDAYSIKPIDAETLQAAAEATSRIVTVEDPFPEGGRDDAAQRRRRRRLPEPLEHDDRGPAQRRLGDSGHDDRTAERVRDDLEPVRVVEQGAARRDNLLDFGHQLRHVCEAERDALECRLAEIEWCRLERQPVDRPFGVLMPAGAPLAAEQGEEGEAVRGGIAVGQRA